MPLLPADFIYARTCKLKCEKFLTRPFGYILSQNRLIIFKMDVPNTLHYSLLYNESKIGRVSF